MSNDKFPVGQRVRLICECHFGMTGVVLESTVDYADACMVELDGFTPKCSFPTLYESLEPIE